MEHTSFLYGALAVFSLLTLATVVHAVCRRARIPFAVGLLLSGVALSLAFKSFGLSFLEYVEFSPEIVFFVLLPTLIFESAYHLHFRYFQGVLREVIILASVGLLIAIAVTSFGLSWAVGLPLGVCLLFGALISATDPVAVLAIFKEMHAPEKLETIVDGESLINDATALMIFQFLLGAVVITPIVIDTSHLVPALGSFALSLIEGLAVGLILGYIFSIAISKATTKGVQLTLSLVLAHMTFLIAEGVLNVSGILATVVAALVMGNFGRRKLSSGTKKSFSEIWSFLGFVSNAMIFLLLGIKIGQLDLAQYGSYILWAIALVTFVARPVSVFIAFFISNLFRKKSRRITGNEQAIVMWGGMRGALAAAAVLLIPESYEYAALLQSMTAGVILGSFLINGLSVSGLLQKLHITDLTKGEQLQQCEAKILMYERIFGYLKSLLERKYIGPKYFVELEEHYVEEKTKAQDQLQKLKKEVPKYERETEKILTHYALGIELKTYKRLFELREISENRFMALQGSIIRQLDYIEDDVLPEERKETNKVAPCIPKQPQRINKIKMTWLRRWFCGLFQKHKTARILSRMMHYRARRIASWKVISEFEELSHNHEIFKNSRVLRTILKRYRCWNKNSELKMSEMENKFPKIITPERLRMAEQECFKKEQSIEKDFLEKGFLNKKVFEELEEDTSRRAKNCRRGSSLFHL